MTFTCSSRAVDCSQKTKELVIDRCNKIESKRKKLQRSQTKEKNRVLEQTQAHADLQQLTKVTAFCLLHFIL